MENVSAPPLEATTTVSVSTVVVPENALLLNNNGELAATARSKPINGRDAAVQDAEEDIAPKDVFNVGFILMVILGMSTAYAWNFFVTAAEYFHYSFRNTAHPEETTHLQNIFENALAVVAMGVGLLAIVVNTVLTRYISFKYRIYTGLFVIITIFLVTTVLAKVNTDSWQEGFFTVTMISVVFINFSSNLVAGGLFGVQGCLPSRFATALMVGQTIAGIFAALASIFAVLAGNGGGEYRIKNEAVGYFSSAIAMSVLAVVAFMLFLRLPIVNFYLAPVVGITIVKTIEDTATVHNETVVLVKEPFSLGNIISRTWTYCTILVLNFFVTLAMFPAVASTVRSTHESNGSIMTNELFLPLSCFLVINSGDLAGRLAHNFLRWPNPEQRFISLTAAVLRLGFIPLIMLCNAQPRYHLPVVFGDASFVFILAGLMVTNGYLGNLGVMYGPKLVSPQFAETSGSLMGACMTLGLFLGAASSFVWSAIL